MLPVEWISVLFQQRELPSEQAALVSATYKVFCERREQIFEQRDVVSHTFTDQHFRLVVIPREQKEQRVFALLDDKFDEGYSKVVSHAVDFSRQRLLVHAVCTPDVRADPVKEAGWYERLGRDKRVVKVYGIISNPCGKTHSLFMELCHRGALSDVLAQLGPYTPENGELLWGWFTTLLNIVKFLEDKQVLHRDLKTDNVFVTADNQLKLGDWGYACLKGEEGEAQPGTVGRVAPEIYRGKVHAKSDVYHLGLILKDMRGQIPGMPTRPDDVWSGSLLHLNVCMLQEDPDCRPSIDECIERAKLARVDWPFT